VEQTATGNRGMAALPLLYANTSSTSGQDAAGQPRGRCVSPTRPALIEAEHGELDVAVGVVSAPDDQGTAAG
jgi:hypothetical protein